MALDRLRNPTPPPQGKLSMHDVQKHFEDLNFFLENTPSKSGATIADMVAGDDVVVKVNEILSALRASGVINV